MKEKILFRVGYDNKDELNYLFCNIRGKLECIAFTKEVSAYYPNKLIIDNCIIYFKSNYSRDIDTIAHYDYYFNVKENNIYKSNLHDVHELISKVREIFRKEKERNMNICDRNDYEIEFKPFNFSFNKFNIEKVIFNYPATIVLWKDGSKTVVKCQEGDIFDAEKGLAMCFAKKALGNKGNFNDVFKEWMPEKEPSECNSLIIIDKIKEGIDLLSKLEESNKN